MSSPARLAALALGLAIVCPPAPARADEKNFGIACRSVHLQYPGPAGTIFVNEVVVDRSAPGTYFCVCGFDKGYLGLQELGRGRKLLIFSVWDPGDQNDPDSVAADRRAKLIEKDPQVRVGRFGNEGTGGQSFLDLDWKPGATYRFAVSARVRGERTEYTAYLQEPGAKTWRTLATFSTLAQGKALGGYNSFVEDFRRDRVSTTKSRRAQFGGGWIRTLDGRWVALDRARFTADANPAVTIDAGLAGDRFFLATGGSTRNETTKLRDSIRRAEARAEPIDPPAPRDRPEALR
ncbi:MAG: DUF3472 domain-containing protein [Isosphaeraceae bacterium]|nr:DUF3472 domain-containing protein [Isosphaeraceae bacterium]